MENTKPTFPNDRVDYLNKPKHIKMKTEDWIKVQKQEDLPQEKKLFKFIPCNHFDEEFIGWIDNEFDEVFFVDFNYYQIKKEVNSCFMKNNSWLPSQITHYMPIQ